MCVCVRGMRKHVVPGLKGGVPSRASVCWKVEGQGVPGPGGGIAGCVCACGEVCEDRVC